VISGSVESGGIFFNWIIENTQVTFHTDLQIELPHLPYWDYKKCNYMSLFSY